MPTGTVVSFSRRGKFGFIKPQEGDKDVFVHISDVQKAGWRELKPSERVTYELGEYKGRPCAVELRAAAL